MKKRYILSIDRTLKKLNNDLKLSLLRGNRYSSSNGLSEFNIKPTNFADGPNGIRKPMEDYGIENSPKATCFPCEATLAQTWNPKIVKEVAENIAIEAKHFDINVLFAPNLTIKKNPLDGRSFEYFSEDPFLNGKMGESFVKGLQENKVGSCIKHYILNNKQNDRFLTNSIISKTALNEIYLKPFKYIIESSKPYALRTSYNFVNNYKISDNPYLMNKLRFEYNFNGVIVNDYGEGSSRVNSLINGIDLDLPGNVSYHINNLKKALKKGLIEDYKINKSARRMLRLNQLTKSEADLDLLELDYPAHHKLSGKAAEEGAVLLKNNGMLPLSHDTTYLVIGEYFKKMRYQGNGSSLVNPSYITTPSDAFRFNKAKYSFVKGFSYNSYDEESDLLHEALNKANEFDNIIVFLGLTDYDETEGVDRDSLKLPHNQLVLMKALSYLHKNITVVLFGGGVIDTNEFDYVNSILYMGLPGENGGVACYNLLYGLSNPSGRLTETWVNNYLDVPYRDEFSNLNVGYKEDQFVGYRYYDTLGLKVKYPFGYGLSYSSFKHGLFAIKEEKACYTILLSVSNITNIPGFDTIQVYASKPESSYLKPKKVLVGFNKVYVDAYKTVNCEIKIYKEDLKSYNQENDQFMFEEGYYTLIVAENVNESLHSFKLHLKGTEFKRSIYTLDNLSSITDHEFYHSLGLTKKQDHPVLPITFDSSFKDAIKTKYGKKFITKILRVYRRKLLKARRISDSIIKVNTLKSSYFIQNTIMNLSFNELVNLSAGIISYKKAYKAVCKCNNQYFKAFMISFKKESSL